MDTDIDEMDWARLAMAIDCEGSISIARFGKNHRYHELIVGVWNTNYILVDWVDYHFGATITKNTRSAKNSKAEYGAVLYSRNAEWVLNNIKPYLLLKEEQADTALEFQSTIGNQGERLSPEILAYREQLFLKMKNLNRRGLQQV